MALLFQDQTCNWRSANPDNFPLPRDWLKSDDNFWYDNTSVCVWPLNANSFSNFTLLLTLIFNTYVLGQLPKISHQTIYFNKEKQKRTAENQTTTDVTILWISSVPFQGRRRHTPVKVYWSDSLPSMGFWTSTLGGMFMGWWWYLKKCSVTISGSQVHEVSTKVLVPLLTSGCVKHGTGWKLLDVLLEKPVWKHPLLCHISVKLQPNSTFSSLFSHIQFNVYEHAVFRLSTTTLA